jgi:hypothetical protein
MNISKLDLAEMYIKRVLETRPSDKTANGMLKRVADLRNSSK